MLRQQTSPYVRLQSQIELRRLPFPANQDDRIPVLQNIILSLSKKFDKYITDSQEDIDFENIVLNELRYYTANSDSSSIGRSVAEQLRKNLQTYLDKTGVVEISGDLRSNRFYAKEILSKINTIYPK